MASMFEKLKDAEPYNIFFTAHPNVEETHNHKNFIIFSDLFCPSLGNLKYILHMSTSMEIEWLLEEFDRAGLGNIPKTLIYGKDDFEMEEYIKNNHIANVLIHKMKVEDQYGKHLSKMTILVYDDDSLRVVVTTANTDDVCWTQYGQIVWISPVCKPTAASVDSGTGPTYFKSSLLRYLKHYPPDVVGECTQYIEKADFSEVKVFLVTSVTGSHPINDPESECILERVAHLLSKYCNIPDENPNRWQIVVQSSTIGNFGLEKDWFRPALLRSINSHSHNQKPRNSPANVKILYPTKENVLNSVSVNYEPELHLKYFLHEQVWQKKMLCSWKADRFHLTKVMPRTKTYCRISPCGTKLAWFLLTSANTSKGAWGGRINKLSKIYVRSFQLGILFLPKLFGKDYFQINNGDETTFPLMFDTPLSHYEDEDQPWISDKLD